MENYLFSIADQKQRLTLQNMQMLISKELIPEDMAFYGKLFLFNKFLKTCKNGIFYTLIPAAIDFISNNFDADLIDNGEVILQKTWDNVYKKAMEPMREYLKNHKGLFMYPYDFVFKYDQKNIKIYADTDRNLKYVDHNGKRLHR